MSNLGMEGKEKFLLARIVQELTLELIWVTNDSKATVSVLFWYELYLVARYYRFWKLCTGLQGWSSPSILDYKGNADFPFLLTA